jgi:ABC-type multidrug transport system ATPase subunit
VTRVRFLTIALALLPIVGLAIALTTQYLEEADDLANYVAVIDKGRLVESNPRDSRRQAKHDYQAGRLVTSAVLTALQLRPTLDSTGGRKGVWRLSHLER